MHMLIHYEKCGNILFLCRMCDEHLSHFSLVLKILHEQKLYANVKKYRFDMKYIRYLNFIVDEIGFHGFIRDTGHPISPTQTNLLELEIFLVLGKFHTNICFRLVSYCAPSSYTLAYKFKEETCSNIIQ